MSTNEPTGPESPERPAQDTPAAPARPLSGHLSFDAATAGKRALREDFNYWTGHITGSSVQLAFGVIAANWAAFQSVDAVLSSIWSKLSLFSALASLAVNTVGARSLARQIKEQFEYADADPQRWASEYNHAQDNPSRWPYTARIEATAALIREGRVWLPVLGGVFFVLAVLIR